ncbi:MAG TPA: type II toxin-antitoxin system VapC family toxin [Alloacidobacterium sp.]|nr:type II toxin-antitoxin system VapC family toxin [Alloacidobacterium sp.]
MILLDTHVVLWLALQPEKISPKATKAIQASRSSGDGLCISPISLWEIAQLVERNRVKLNIPLEAFLDMTERNFLILPINAKIAYFAQQFSDAYPRDPADRMIGATALIEGISLVTSDDRIRRSGEVQTIW